MLWQVAFLFAGALIVGGVIYLVSRFHQFALLKSIARQNKLLSWLLAAVPVAALGLACCLCFNVTTTIVVVLHLILFWLLCDLAAAIIKKIRKKPFRHYYPGAAALVITALYLGAGWYFAHHVYETHYQFSTTKDLGMESLRVVALADSHLGITLDGEEFTRQMERIQQTDPDIVVIVGDFVDDDADKGDMIAACRALGKLETTYGVYFVFGNHDEGYWGYRNFTSQELRTALTENNVTILTDDAILIDDSFYLVGRRDRSMWNRQDAQALTAKLDHSKYIILLDHQPNDYAGETAANADLVLSGHTHGGHIFPAGLIGLAIGANDRVYGTEQREDTTFVVTSGISGWAIPFKTGAISEYVVIDIQRAD